MPPRDPPAEKGCTRCGKLLPAASFSRDPMNPTGLHTRCRKCNLKHNREHRALNATAPLSAEAREPLKFCPRCRRDLPRTAFYYVNSTWDSLSSCCKLCHLEDFI